VTISGGTERPGDALDEAAGVVVVVCTSSVAGANE